MLILSLSFLLTTAFDFEIDQGLVFEPFVGINFLDKHDDSSLATGGKMSWSFIDREDAAWSLEALYTLHAVKNDAQKNALFKHLGEAGILFDEIFNPWRLRFSAGGGVERRYESWNPSLYWRFGMGRAFSSNFSLMIDYSQRWIYREIGNTRENSYPGDFTTGIQWIF